MKLFISFFVLFLCVSGQVYGLDGNSLYNACKHFDTGNDNHAADELYCLAYVSGFSHGFGYGKLPFLGAGNICIPDGVTQGQKALVVKKYLENNPALLHEEIGSVVYDALDEAFPCEKQKTSLFE